jgi:hypothetical protein
VIYFPSDPDLLIVNNGPDVEEYIPFIINTVSPGDVTDAAFCKVLNADVCTKPILISEPEFAETKYVLCGDVGPETGGLIESSEMVFFLQPIKIRPNNNTKV